MPSHVVDFVTSVNISSENEFTAQGKAQCSSAMIAEHSRKKSLAKAQGRIGLL